MSYLYFLMQIQSIYSLLCHIHVYIMTCVISELLHYISYLVSSLSMLAQLAFIKVLTDHDKRFKYYCLHFG